MSSTKLDLINIEISDNVFDNCEWDDRDCCVVCFPLGGLSELARSGTRERIHLLAKLCDVGR